MITSEKPKVTVLISTYNRPQYLGEAIESVINQRYQNWELIVLNDGGIDVAGVVDKFADSRIIYVPSAENKGAAHRFNQGLALARGEYITYLGDDDVFYPNHVEVLAKALDENPNAALSYSDLYAASSVADPRTGKRYILDKRISVSRGFNREFMFHHNHILHVSLMHRLDAARRVGGFDENVKVLIEWSLNRRLAFIYDFVHVEVATGEYHMAVFKSDRISVRERRNTESYKHNLRKIRSNFPAEPWDKVERIDLIYVVDKWGEKLNQHLREIIDAFDHPFYIKLVNNGTGRTMTEIKKSLGNLTDLKSISIKSLSQKEAPILAARHVAKTSNAKYLFLVTPNLEAVKYPKRLFSSLQFMQDNPEHQAVRWNVDSERGGIFDLLITREYFMKCSRPGKNHTLNMQAININIPKGFKFDAMFSTFKKHSAAKKWKESRDVLDGILQEKEGTPHIQYLIHHLTPVCLAQNDYATLEPELRSLIERGYRPDNLIRLGVMLGQAGRWPEAVETLKEAIEAHGLKEADFEAECFPFSFGRKLSIFHLFIALGNSCLQINDLTEAAKYYRLASCLKSDSHEPFLGFAKVWLNSGQLDKAETALHKLPGKGGQDDPETQRLLGALCQRRKELPLAFQCYKRAFEVAPDDSKNVDPFYFVGVALGKWEEMYEPLATCCHKNPQHIMGLARLSAVCFNLNSDTMAQEMAERCLKLDPGNAIAKSILGRLQSRPQVALEDDLSQQQEMVVDISGLPQGGSGSSLSW